MKKQIKQIDELCDEAAKNKPREMPKVNIKKIITRGFLKFLTKFYSSNNLTKEEFREWRNKVRKVDTEKELLDLLKEISSGETVDSLIDTYDEIKAEEEEIEKETGQRILNNHLKDIRAAVLLQLTIKDRKAATEIIVREFEKENYIYTTKDDVRPEMWIYQDGIYIPEGRTFVKEFCRKILGEAYTSTLAHIIIDKIEADTGIEPDKFFKQDHLEEIPVQNGVLNILTKELNEFSPKKIFFNKLPVKYDPLAKCPKIDQFLTDVLASPDDKKVFYEIAGFGLLKEYKLEKAIMFVGLGRNGKTKAIELLKRLVGIENCCSIPLASLIPSSFTISELFGKLFNLAGDLSSRELKNTGMFKALTGRDLVSAQRKFLRDLVFTNYAKMIFACNDLPRVYDYSPGFWERWLLLEFPYMFVDQSIFDKAREEDKKFWKIRDVDIINKISSENELSGFLNKALEGLDLILKKKKFSYTIGTQEIKEKWIRKSDSFMAFCMDCVEEDETASISKQRLRILFSKYCKKHKVKGCSDKAMKITLQNEYGVMEEYTQEFGGSRFTHCWMGIRIKG